jgi:uncharacterized membrane protein HdeD (DUF308 family)
MDTLTAVLALLGRLSGVALSSPVYAAVSALHILGIALLVGGILLVDLRLAGLLRRLDQEAMALLRRSARIGTGLAVGTGVLLVSARPAEYLANPVFLAKMAVLAMALANAIILEAIARHRPLDELIGTPYGRVAAILSLACWPLAIGLGRWIAFV